MNTFKKLSKNEMKMVLGGELGGGTCCFTVVSASGSLERDCGYSKDEAIAEATAAGSAGDGTRGYWCCASC